MANVVDEITKLVNVLKAAGVDFDNAKKGVLKYLEDNNIPTKASEDAMIMYPASLNSVPKESAKMFGTGNDNDHSAVDLGKEYMKKVYLADVLDDIIGGIIPKPKNYTPEQQAAIEEANKPETELKAKREAFGEKVREANNVISRYNSNDNHDGVTEEEMTEATQLIDRLNSKLKLDEKPKEMSYAKKVEDSANAVKTEEAKSARNLLGAHDSNNELIENEDEAIHDGIMDPSDVSLYKQVYGYLEKQKKAGKPFNEAWKNFVSENNDKVNTIMNVFGNDKLYKSVVDSFKRDYDKIGTGYTPDNAAIKLAKAVLAAKKRRLTLANNQVGLLNDVAKDAVATSVDKDVGPNGELETKITSIAQPGAKELLQADTPEDVAAAKEAQKEFEKNVRKLNYGYSNLGNLPTDTESAKKRKQEVLDKASRWVTMANEAKNKKYSVNDFLEMYDKHPNIKWTINGSTNAYRGGERLNLILSDFDKDAKVPEKAIVLTGKDVQTFLDSIQEADRDIPVDIRIVNRGIKARDQGEDDNTSKYVNRYKNMLKYANPDFVFGDPTIQEFGILPYGTDVSGLSPAQIKFLKTPVDRDRYEDSGSFRLDMPDYYEPLADVIKNSSERGLRAYNEGNDLKYGRVSEMKPVYKDWNKTDDQVKETEQLGENSDIAKPIVNPKTVSSRNAKFNKAIESEDAFTPISAKSLEKNDLYDMFEDNDTGMNNMSWGLEDPTTGLPVLIKDSEDPDTGISTYRDVRTGITYPIDTDKGDVPSQLKELRQELLKNQDADLYPYTKMKDLPETTQKLARLRLQNAVKLMDALEDPAELEKEGRPLIDRKFVDTPSGLRMITNRIKDLMESNPEKEDFRDMIENGNLFKLTRKGNLRDIFGPVNSITRTDDKTLGAGKDKLRNLIKAYMLMSNYDLNRNTIPWEDMRTLIDGEITNLGKLDSSSIPEGMDIEDLLDTFKNARTIVTKGSEIYGGAMDKESLKNRLAEINAPLIAKKKELEGKSEKELTDKEKAILEQPLLTMRNFRKQLEQKKLDFNQDFYNAMASEVGKKYDQELGDALDKMSMKDRIILEAEKADRAKNLAKSNGPTMVAALRYIFEPLAEAGVPKAKAIIEALDNAMPSSAQIAKTGFNALTNLLGMTPTQANVYLANKDNPDREPTRKRAIRGKAKNYYSPYSDASRLLDKAQDLLVDAEFTDNVDRLIKQTNNAVERGAKQGNPEAIKALKLEQESKSIADQMYDGISDLLNKKV